MEVKYRFFCPAFIKQIQIVSLSLESSQGIRWFYWFLDGTRCKEDVAFLLYVLRPYGVFPPFVRSRAAELHGYWDGLQPPLSALWPRNSFSFLGLGLQNMGPIGNLLHQTPIKFSSYRTPFEPISTLSLSLSLLWVFEIPLYSLGRPVITNPRFPEAIEQRELLWGYR